MNGTKFISNLKRLEVPGAESLSGDDLDYIFLEPQNKPLVEFLEYFFSNTTLNDKLSESEIVEYEELLSNGQILSGKYLEQMELFVEPFMADLEIKCPTADLTDDCEEEIEHLENKFHILSKRKDFLNLQKITEAENLNKKRNQVQFLSQELERARTSLESVSQIHTKAVSKLSNALEKTSAKFILFEEDEEEAANFFSQLPIQKWHRMEEEFSEAVETYVEKQFKEGVDTLAGQNDVSPYSIIDSGQLNMQLVRGPGQAEYLRNAKELNRVSKMIEICEVETVVNEIERSRNRSEMEEALKFLKMIKGKSVNSLIIHKQNIELEEMKIALEQDLQFQMKYLENQALKVAQLERLKTISGNYEVKLQRQEYFLSKQKLVIDLLSRQLSRYDLMNIVFALEKQNIDSALEVLMKMNKLLSGNQKKFLGRMEHLNNTWKKLKHLDDSGEIYNELLPMAKLLSSNDEHSKENILISDVASLLKNLETSLTGSQSKVNQLIEQQTRHLMSMCNFCMLLEECLFGKTSVLGTLPASWLPNDLIERQAQMEQKMWETQTEMVTLIKDYEGKKKVLQANPKANDLLEWTESVINKYSNSCSGQLNVIYGTV